MPCRASRSPSSSATCSSLASDPPQRFRLFLGYAGWGDGQLMQEILRNDWLPRRWSTSWSSPDPGGHLGRALPRWESIRRPCRHGPRRGRRSRPTDDFRRGSDRRLSRIAAARGAAGARGRHGRHPGHGGRRGAAVGAGRAGQAGGRARLRFLHQPRQPQGPRARAERLGRAVLLLALAPAAGARRGSGGIGLRPGVRCLLRQPAARQPDRRLGIAAELAATLARRRSTNACDTSKRASPMRSSRGRRSGAGTGSCPLRIEIWEGRESRLHDRLLFERDGAGWRTQRLWP